jgi:hypothetical protein
MSMAPTEAIYMSAVVLSVREGRQAYGIGPRRLLTSPRGNDFELIGFDEGGVQGTPENLRLVCVIKGGGKFAVWGQESARKNIDAILKVGLPCVVHCQPRPPRGFAASKFGHTHWLQEDTRLGVTGHSMCMSARSRFRVRGPCE